MGYKMIAVDLDDTLLDSRGAIPERVSRAVRAATAAGVRVVLCTGRVIKGMRRFYDELGLNTLIITSGGAEIYDAGGHIIFARPVEPKAVTQILRLAAEYGVHAQVYIDGEIVYQKRNEFTEKYERANGFSGIEMPGLSEREDIVTPKVLILANARQILELQRTAQARFPRLAIRRSQPEYLEFYHPDVNKGEAMKFAAAYYGVGLSDVVAIGDSQLDIPMIEAAGLGVAVNNASPETRKAAKMICASNDDAGVADVIEKVLSEGNYENKA